MCFTNIHFHALSRAEARRGLKLPLYDLWLLKLQSAKKEWQAFKSGDSELDYVPCDFTYGKVLLRSRSQSWRREMSLLLCRSSGLCCSLQVLGASYDYCLAAHWRSTWARHLSPACLRERAVSVWRVCSVTRCLLTHNVISINGQGGNLGKTWLFRAG